MAIKFLNTVAVDTDVLYVDAASNEVGINTTSPTHALHVKSSDQQVATFESTDANKSMIVLKNADSSNSLARFYIQDGRVVLGEDNNHSSRSNLKIEKQSTRTYTEAHMNFGGTGVPSKDKVSLHFRYDTADDDSYNGLAIGGTITGTTALTADRGVNGINIDINSTAAGGNTAQELTLKGVNIDVANQTDGDANHLYGVFASAKNVRTGTGDNMTSITGGYFQAYSSAQTGQVSNMYGVEAITYIEDATHTVNNAYAVYGRTTIDSSFDDTISTRSVGGYFTSQVESGNDSQVPQSVGVYAENEVSSNITNIKGVEIIADINAGTTTNSYLIKGDTQIAGGAAITNNWGLHLDDVDKNYIDGTLGINNSNPTAQLVVRNSGVSNSVLKLEDSGGTQLLGVFEDSDGNAELSMRDGTGAMTIKFDTAGWSFINGARLGIGTSTPSQTLEVAGNIQATSSTGPLISAVYDADHYMRIEGNSSGGILKGADGGVITTLIRTYSSSYFNGGNVGIGTTSPSQKLEVDGNVLLQNNDEIRFKDSGGTERTAIELDPNNDLNIGTSAGGNLRFINGSSYTERMRIKTAGQVQFNTYGSGTFTGTAAKNLAVDSSGNIIETDGSIMDGSGTANYVSKWSDANTLTDSQIFDNGTNVGINTSSPSEKLEVNGTIKTSTGLIKGANASAYINLDGTVGSRLRYGNQYITANASNLVFSTNDNIRMTVTNAGNVGIGTTTPAEKLDINGNINIRNTASGVRGIKRSDDGYNLHLAGGSSLTGGSYIELNGGSRGGVGNALNGEINFVSGGSYQSSQSAVVGNYNFKTQWNGSSATLMHIDSSSGNVGIGTTSPAEKLVVSEARSGSNASDQTKYTLVSRSTISSGTPGTGGIKVVYDDGSNEHAFGLVSGSTSADFLTSGPMHWYTNSDLNTHNATGFAMTIDTSQRVGIGTTSPSYKLDVNGDGRINGLTFVASGATRKISTHSNSGQLQLNGGTNSSGGAYININGSGYSSGSMILYSPESIYLNSNVGIGTASPDRSLVINHASDTRVKLQVNGTDTAQIQTVANEARYHALGSSTPLQFWTNGAERARIDTSGNFGIGTASPTTDLHVDGSALITSNATVRGDLIIDKNPSSMPTAKLQFLRNSSTSPAMGEIIMNDNPGHAGMFIYARKSSSPYTTSYIELPTSVSYDFEINLLGNNALTIDSYTRNVGIGTTTPASVVGFTRNLTISGSSASIVLDDTDASAFEIASSSDSFRIYNEANERMRVTSAGNVGIGEASPAERLHISGSVDNDDVAIRIDNDSDDNSSSTPPSAAVVFNTASNNGYVRVFGAPADTAANHKMDIGATAGSSYLTFSPSGSEKMRIASSGNVGIGTASPRTKLDINGPLAVVGGTFTSGASGADSSSSTGIVLRRGKKIFSGIPSSSNQDFYLRNLIEQDTGNNINIGQTGTSLIGNVTLSTGTSGNVIFRTTGSESVRIDSSGNVGINETSPQQKLHVGGRGLFETGGSTADATTSTYEKGITLTGGNMRLVIDTSNVSNAGSYIQTRHSSTTYPNAYYTLALNPLGGKVGIGTNSPSHKLEVVGDGVVVSDGTDQGIIYLRSDRTDTYIKENGNYQIETGAPSGILFECDSNSNGNGIFNIKRQGASRFYITDGGNIGIGTTSPAEKLTVSASDDVVIRVNSTKNGTWTTGQSLGALEFFGNDASGGQGAGLKGKIDLTSFNQYGAAFDMKFFTSNGSTDPTTENFKIAYDGGIFAPNLLGSSNSNPDVRYNTTTDELYYNSSSIRYKEDVTDLENSLDKINNLRPVKFKDKGSGEYATGLIAEEVVNVLPELVFKRQIEGFNEPQIDGVSYGDLHAYYIKAIQQLKSEIETLKSQIN